MSHSARKSSVRKILENANAYEWSLEAIGVLRLCLSETVKLDVWDTDFAISGAMHSHDSDFQSTVIAGEFASCVWRPSVRAGSLFNRRLIGRKPGSPSAATTEVVRLKASREKTIGEAGRCLQRAHEICATRALRGTVTLVELGQRTDLEHVFWPHDEECDRTQPRLATDAEVAAIAGYALERWFAPRRKDADAPVQRLEQESRPTGRPVSGTSAQCTCPAPEPAATIDPRVHVLAAGLFEIEAGGPGGIVTWGATGMRDRARRALVEAGLLSRGAHRRAAAETESGLQSALGQ